MGFISCFWHFLFDETASISIYSTYVLSVHTQKQISFSKHILYLWVFFTKTGIKMQKHSHTIICFNICVQFLNYLHGIHVTSLLYPVLLMWCLKPLHYFIFCNQSILCIESRILCCYKKLIYIIHIYVYVYIHK